MKFYGLLLLSFLFLAMGCGDKTCSEELRTIEEYIEDNNLTTQDGMEGLKYIILDPGTGAGPLTTDMVTVNYTGTLTNDEFFDGTPSDGNSPISFSLQGVIRGWTLGVPFIGRGGRIQLFIPSELGYGSRGVGSICPNSDLIFEIELVNF